jgi:DNA processing protein
MDALTLLQVRGFTANTLRDLIRAREEMKPGELLSRFQYKDGEYSKARTIASRLLDLSRRLGISVICMADREYPARLLEIEDPPPLLYVKGPVELLSTRCVAVVGTREASNYGLQISHIVAQTAVEYDYAVVSGLATGIDSAAHRGALDAKGKTIAVLAHGLDIVYPPQHKELAQEIVNSGGCLVSEHSPGTPIKKREFVMRNRIQSGMSCMSVIVESGKTGGSIHQGRFTHEQGRPLYVVFLPTDTNEFNLLGAHYLISHHGAKPISSRAELVAYLKNCGRSEAQTTAAPLG